MSKSLSQFRLERKYQQRIYIFSGFIFICTVGFLMQLGSLQVLHGRHNRILAKKFVSRQEFTRAPRGLIYDRNYGSTKSDSLLVKNISYIDYVIYPSRFKNRQEGLKYLQKFSAIMGMPMADFRKDFSKRAWRSRVRKNKSITLISHMTRAQQERMAEFRVMTHKGELLTRHLRYYTMGPALAHVTGYIGLPSRRELRQKKALSYQMIGKGGIESRYDRQLRGSDGVRIRHRILDSEEQITVTEHGKNLVLTIDYAVQEAAYKALLEQKRRGTVVAIKASTGEILAMVSTPSFDPNILSSGSSKKRTAHIRQVRAHEGFLNMSIQTKYPPASTFKPLVALTALQEAMKNPAKHLINENTSYQCRGKWRLKSTLKSVADSEYYCLEHRGHGTNNMIGALAKSCNVYFYQLGYRIGPTPIINNAKLFGFNKLTGVDLPGEVKGFVPEKRWKQLKMSSRWYDGDTINLSIGQGFMDVTPIENAVFYGALITKGKMYRPHILKEVRDPISNRVLARVRSDLVAEVPLNPANLAIIERGMRSVLTDGTVRYLNRKNTIPIAGKTGTVQVKSKRKGPNHAWFIGYAPFGAPPEDLVVVAVFVEHAHGGAANAAPVAVKTLQAAFPDWDSTKYVKKTYLKKETDMPELDLKDSPSKFTLPVQKPEPAPQPATTPGINEN